jgi:4-hydroxy-tetrahydrodipicolinate synthase
MLYNMPGCTKQNMSLDTIRKAKELGAIGIKDSSGDLSALYAMIEEFKDIPDFSVISGTELFIPETITFAGHGAIAGGANIFPELFVSLYEATKANDIIRISRLRDIVIQIEKKIYNVGTSSSKYIKSIKCALSVMDICNDYVALPFRKFGTEERAIIEQNIADIQLMMAEMETGTTLLP